MFSYEEAFSRNLGWVTVSEQQALRRKKVAIAGLGGVGGSHLLTLCRMGIGSFSVGDFDTFDIVNFNRQVGATVSNLGRPKADVLVEMATDINPQLQIEKYAKGVDLDNLDDFLAGADLCVDGLDFFAFEARAAMFAECAKRRVPAITAAPLGMGVALLNFLPGSMTFEEYFQLRGQPETEQALRFLLGLSPAMLQMPYLVDKSRVDFSEKRGPSTVMACQLCAGLAATEALKILLNRGGVRTAPWGLHFDAYRSKFVRTWRPWGNRNPLQRLSLAVARAKLTDGMPGNVITNESRLDTLEQILDLARWAPSGDNTQPWRFELRNGSSVVIHGFDTRDHCVYDLDGHSSQVAIGALLENIAIAASRQALRTDVEYCSDSPEERPRFNVHFVADPKLEPDPLVKVIPVRCTQRRAMRTRNLSMDQKQVLEGAVADGYSVLWIEGWGSKRQLGMQLFRYAGLRLRLPEGYLVHREIIEWESKFSTDKIPDQAIGLDPISLKMMRQAMASWERVDFFNTFFGGTLIPRLELDLVPALACAAHFVLIARRPPGTISDYVSAGRAMQRFWLTATSLGLQLQPEMTPLIFSRYVRHKRPFTRIPRLESQARRLAEELGNLLGKETCERGVFMGRIGAGAPPRSRSLRLPLQALMYEASTEL